MFAPETIVADALNTHPKVRWVFAAYHLGGCNGCDRASDETLGELASAYNITLGALLRDLNALLGDDESASGRPARPAALTGQARTDAGRTNRDSGSKRG